MSTKTIGTEQTLVEADITELELDMDDLDAVARCVALTPDGAACPHYWEIFEF